MPLGGPPPELFVLYFRMLAPLLHPASLLSSSSLSPLLTPCAPGDLLFPPLCFFCKLRWVSPRAPQQARFSVCCSSRACSLHLASARHRASSSVRCAHPAFCHTLRGRTFAAPTFLPCLFTMVFPSSAMEAGRFAGSRLCSLSPRLLALTARLCALSVPPTLTVTIFTSVYRRLLNVTFIAFTKRP